MSQLIMVEDRTSPGTLVEGELEALVDALNSQATTDYNDSPWVEHGYAPAISRVITLAKGMKPPPGAWSIILLDDSTQAGALGYHEDETGTAIPFSDVFVKTSREDGASPTEVASHEMCEMICDPDVQNVRRVTHGDTIYIVEVCDPVQGCGYEINGQMVADFCWPRWFGMVQTREALSQRESVKEAFELAPQGYISTAPVSSPEQWGQIFGSQQDRLPAWASRLPRIHKRHIHDRPAHELWAAITRIERHVMSQQDQIDALVTKVNAATADIDAFLAGQTEVDLSSLSAAVDTLDAKAASLNPAPVVAEPDQTVYLFTPAEGVEPSAQFTASGYQTKAAEGQTPTPVEFFSGDTAAGETNGTSVPGYTVVAPADVELVPVPA